jgi:hypothetical protein
MASMSARWINAAASLMGWALQMEATAAARAGSREYTPTTHTSGMAA